MENAAFEKPHTFHISFDVGINRTTSINPDLQIDLKLNYPHGILVDGDPVEISGIAVINTPIAENIEVINLVYQNGQAYPTIQDSRGIAEGMNFALFRVNESRFEGRSVVTWNLIGTYYPEIYITTIRNKNHPLIHHSDTKDMAITVFPRTELIQIATNKATLLLACAAYLIALMSAFNIIYNLWNKKPANQVYNKEENGEDEKHTTNTEGTISDVANGRIIIMKDPNKSSRPDCPEREAKK